jgi:hypothetical protein
MTNWNLVDWTVGGLRAFEDFAGIDADLLRARSDWPCGRAA